MLLAQVVQAAVTVTRQSAAAEASASLVSVPPPVRESNNEVSAHSNRVLPVHLSTEDTSDHIHLDTQSRDSQVPGQRFSTCKTPPDTPATRTGPPRSLSFAYSLPQSSSKYDSSTQFDFGDPHSSSHTSPDFRGALESIPSRDKDRKGKRRESRSDDGRPVCESSQDETSRSAVLHKSPELNSLREESEHVTDWDRPDDGTPFQSNNSPRRHFTNDEKRNSMSTSQPKYLHGLRRVPSLPLTHPENKGGKAKWAKLRSLFPSVQNFVSDRESADLSYSSIAVPKVSITDELIAGGLSTLMLRLYLERDEKGRRRVPILLHRLRIRISDSYHPTEEKRTVFRIECEYANGAARWVVYRQLRDFLSLHAHYTVSNVYNRLGDPLPEFPMTSELYLDPEKMYLTTIIRPSLP